MSRDQAVENNVALSASILSEDEYKADAALRARYPGGYSEYGTAFQQYVVGLMRAHAEAGRRVCYGGSWSKKFNPNILRDICDDFKARGLLARFCWVTDADKEKIPEEYEGIAYVQPTPNEGETAVNAYRRAIASMCGSYDIVGGRVVSDSKFKPGVSQELGLAIELRRAVTLHTRFGGVTELAARAAKGEVLPNRSILPINLDDLETHCPVIICK